VAEYNYSLMARIDAVIDDNLEQEFRMEITKRLGGRKGDLSKALEEAIHLWVSQRSKNKMRGELY
jgi:hypothetical protein